MKRLPVLAVLLLLCATGALASNLVSVGYFNGSDDAMTGQGFHLSLD